MASCKSWAKENAEVLGQLICFAIAKLLIALVELPNNQKMISYSPLLIIAVVFYFSAFVLKIIKEKGRVINMIITIYIRQFLIWIVSLLSMIFTFSLSHQLGWNLLETVFLIVCQILGTSTLVILCSWHFIDKVEFIFYEVILSVNILALGIKTVIFIEYDLDSPHKDIVLLNLTTQIALTIIYMDSIERAYSKSLTRRPPVNNLVQQQMAASNV